MKDSRANPFDVAVALGLITGRRCIEIFKSAEFTAVNDHAAIFQGQAKKGDVAEPAEYEIPMLAPPDLVNTALARLRTAKDCTALSNREVVGFGGTASYDSTLNGKVLDLAIREAVDRLVEGAEKGGWTPGR